MSARNIRTVMEAVSGACSCPAHARGSTAVRMLAGAGSVPDTDYAFEMATSSVRVGRGVTRVSFLSCTS